MRFEVDADGELLDFETDEHLGGEDSVMRMLSPALAGILLLDMS